MAILALKAWAVLLKPDTVSERDEIFGFVFCVPCVVNTRFCDPPQAKPVAVELSHNCIQLTYNFKHFFSAFGFGIAAKENSALHVLATHSGCEVNSDNDIRIQVRNESPRSQRVNSASH